MLALPHKITSDSRKYIYIIVTACLSKGLAQKLVFFAPCLYFERFGTNYSSGRKTCKKCSMFRKPNLTLHKCVYFLEDTCMVEI